MRKGNWSRAHASASDAPTTPFRSVLRGPSRVSCRSLRSDQRQTLRQTLRFPPARPPLTPSIQSAIFHLSVHSFSILAERRERFAPRFDRANHVRECVYVTRGEIESEASESRAPWTTWHGRCASPKISRALPGDGTCGVQLRKNFVHGAAALDDLELQSFHETSKRIFVCQLIVSRKATVPQVFKNVQLNLNVTNSCRKSHGAK